LLPPEYGGGVAAGKHLPARVSSHTLPHTPEHTASTAPSPADQRLSPTEAWRALLALLNTRTTIRLADRRKTKIAYPRRAARPAADFADAPPTAPAAIHVYDRAGFTRFWPLDLDAHDRTPEQIAAVEADLAAATTLLDETGCIYLVDRAHGGAHVYVLLEDPLSADDARTLITALTRRLPTLDPKPVQNASDGLITIPGSVHRLGGHRELTVDADAAWATIAGTHTPARALQRLRAALVDELRAIAHEDAQRGAQAREAARAAGSTETLSAIADDDVRAITVRGIGRHMSAKLAGLAADGDWRAADYASASEARRAVLMSAVATGMQQTDVQARMLDGRWPGLRSLFAHKGLDRLTYEYRRAAEEIARRDLTAPPGTLTRDDSAVRSDTSAKTHRGGGEGSPSVHDAHGTIRAWITLVERHAAAEYQGTRGWDRQMALRSLGQAASMTGSTLTAMGVRWHALALGCSRTEAAQILRELAAETDPWVVLVARGRGIEADTYQLRIPDRHADLLEDLRWRSGKTHAVRPVFTVLGRPTGLLYEAIERGATTRARIALVTGLRADAYRDARDTALTWGLITGNDRDGYQIAATDADLERLAEILGAIEARTRRLDQHRRERAAYWAQLAAIARTRPWIRLVRDVDDTDPEVEALLHQMRLDELDDHDPGWTTTSAATA